jgi:hypothetical protein
MSSAVSEGPIGTEVSKSISCRRLTNNRYWCLCFEYTQQQISDFSLPFRCDTKVNEVIEWSWFVITRSNIARLYTYSS